MSTERLLRGQAKRLFIVCLLLSAIGLGACSSASVTTPRQTVTPGQTGTAPAQTAITPAPTSASTTTCTLLPKEVPPPFVTVEFKTDWSRHCVHYSEILSGGPPRDGIPALSAPKFLSASQANTWLKPNEPVVFFQVGDDARAYPIQILIWHEIVNDTVGGSASSHFGSNTPRTAPTTRATVRRQ